MDSSLSERGRVAVGYAPRDPFGSTPGSRNSGDVDFTDVFGGPPRRSSINEMRRSRPDSMESGSWRRSGSGSGSGLGERPVFGELSSPARRRHLKDDFFNDIFQSGESACSSPRRAERDSLNSPTSGSRVLSPTRTLPPPVRSEVVAGGSSLPAQLRLSMKLGKVIDHLTSSPTQDALYKNEEGYLDTFPSSPSTSIPSSTSRAGTTQDNLKIDGHASYRQSPLSHQISHSLDKSSDVTDSSRLSMKGHSQRDPANLESYVSQGQFHFSIYKWAGKGVKLIAPSEALQHKCRFKRLPEIVVQEIDVILHADNISSQSTPCKNQYENLDKPVADMIVETTFDADSTTETSFLLNELDSKFGDGNETEKSDIGNSVNENIHEATSDAQKHDLKNLQQLFEDDYDKQQSTKIAKQVEGTKEYLRRQENAHSNINSKQQSTRENKGKPANIATPNIRDATSSPEEKLLGSRVKGKVKDFIKIFNQEGSPKRKGIFETPVRRSKGKDDGKGKVEDSASIPTAKADGPAKTASKDSSSTLPETPVPMYQSSDPADKVNFNINIDVHTIDDSFFERKDPPRQHSESTPDFIDASACNMEESNYEDLEGYLVEPLSEDQNKDLKSNSDKDQIKEIDAKIRNWSKGKEGNIRSLLSTLQYVLWPESGWKPIPLVDIIEGSSVKKAYQKALLRLHPDKLQQKGAADHEKYIAEKVFDIMQDAWDQFNSSSQVYWHGDD